MFLGVIPARFQSSRFPGKVLAKILGKTLVQRTYEQAKRACELSRVVVATDDESVLNHVIGFGGEAVLTSLDCPSGSDRVAEAVERYFPEAEYIINVQADEPLIEPSILDQLAREHRKNREAPLMTPVSIIEDESEIECRSIVKCVFDCNHKALYFSRNPIPFPQKKRGNYYRHMGIYSFRRDFLLEYAKLGSTPLREVEDLEQLKAMEHGYPIYVTVVKASGSIEVNTPEDVLKVEKILCRENISLSQEALSPR